MGEFVSCGLASEIPPLLLLPYLHDWVEQARASGPGRCCCVFPRRERDARPACSCPMRRVSRSASSHVAGRCRLGAVWCRSIDARRFFALPTVSRGPQGSSTRTSVGAWTSLRSFVCAARTLASGSWCRLARRHLGRPFGPRHGQCQVRSLTGAVHLSKR